MSEVSPERLRSAMEQKGLNQSQLASIVGIRQPSIGRLLAGETKTSRHLLRLAAALEVDAADLMEDDDAVSSSAEDRQRSFRGFPVQKPADDVVDLEEIDMRFGLGGTFIDHGAIVQRRPFSRAWLRQISSAPPDQLFWTAGDGDSMEPTIRSGEIMLIDRSQTSPRMGDGIWALAFGDIGMVKRVRPMPDGSVQILSDNPSVPPMTAVDGEMHVIGRVVAVVRRL